MTFLLPHTYYYTEHHEWISLHDDTASIGLTHYSPACRGLVINIHLTSTGIIRKGSRVCEIESSKVILDIKSPLSGEIEEINQPVLDSPELVTQDPYSSWIVRMKFAEPGELGDLLTLAEYEDFLQTLWKK
jgi:glycine cleavage system H protein